MKKVKNKYLPLTRKGNEKWLIHNSLQQTPQTMPVSDLQLVYWAIGSVFLLAHKKTCGLQGLASAEIWKPLLEKPD